MKIFINLILTVCFLAFSVPSASAKPLTGEEVEYSHEDQFSSGDQLDTPSGTFTIIEKLGEGFFGKVYSVQNEAGEKFAIKCQKSNRDFGPLGDVDREFERGQFLDHPNILKSIDCFPYKFSDCQEGKILVLELIEGNPLHDVGYASIDKQIAVEGIFKIIDALKYALAYDLIHLDLHAGNVMINQVKEPIVIDLASFFRFEELLTQVEAEVQKQEDVAMDSPAPRTAKNIAPMPKKKKPAPAPVPEKIKKLFVAHPELVAQLKQLVKEKHVPKPGNKAGLHHKALKTPSKPAGPSIDEKMKAPVFSYYFRSISTLCERMIYVSNMSRAEKIDLHTEMMKLVWSYMYDIEDGEYIDFGTYFGKLEMLLIDRSVSLQRF